MRKPAVPAVPRNHHISLLRSAALLLLCLLQAGEPTDAGRRACLGRGPAALLGSPSAADASSIPFLTPSRLHIPYPGLHPLAAVLQPTGGMSHQPISHTGRHPQTGKGQRGAGGARPALRQGSAPAAAAPNPPRQRLALGLLPAAPGPID